MGAKAPFDPLLRLGLPAPQNADVPKLQNKAGVRMLGDVLPHFRTLVAFKQSFVDLDLDKVAGLELLSNLRKDCLT